jgi:hypothetical protein
MKDFIILKGTDAVYNTRTSRLQWNGIDNRFFPNFLNSGTPDGNVDIYMKLNAINFTGSTDIDGVATSVDIDTNLNFNNMVPTSSSSILGIVSCTIDQDSTPSYYISSDFIMSDIQVKISRFSSIQIGIIHQSVYLDLDALKDYCTIVLEIEYIRNSNQKTI